MLMFSIARKMLLPLAMLSAVTLSGCAKMTGIAATNSAVCEVWKPIGWASKDTDQTIVEVKVNNARRQGWCKAGK